MTVPIAERHATGISSSCHDVAVLLYAGGCPKRRSERQSPVGLADRSAPPTMTRRDYASKSPFAILYNLIENVPTNNVFLNFNCYMPDQRSILSDRISTKMPELETRNGFILEFKLRDGAKSPPKYIRISFISPETSL